MSAGDSIRNWAKARGADPFTPGQCFDALDEDVLIWVPYHYGSNDSSGSKRWWERAPKGKNETRRMPS